MNYRLACATLLCTAMMASAAELRRRPYLQDVRPDRAEVLWSVSGDSGRGEVRYSSDGIQWASQTSSLQWLPSTETGLPDSLFLHRASLRGLSPGTFYSYRVLVDGQDVLPAAAQQDLRFRTPGLGEASFRFLVFGDSGDGATEQGDIANRMIREPAEFVLHTGDLAYDNGSFEELENYYFRAYWPMMRRMAFFPVPGNHDYYSNDAYAYRSGHWLPQDRVPADGRGMYYSFDWGNAHFVALDTNAPFAEALAGTGKMLEWLDADLARTRQAWRIVYFHHTPFPTAVHRDDEVCAQAREEITPILERQQVHLVFAGHEHLYQRTKARRNGQFINGRGTVYITTGGGGSRVYDAGEDAFIAKPAGVSHYLRADVEGASLTVEAVSRTGEVLDHVVLVSTPLVEGVADASGKIAVAAGGLISLYGIDLAPADVAAESLPWPMRLNGVSVAIGEASVPLLFAGRGQINGQLPFGLTGDMRLQVSTPQGSAEWPLRVLGVAPSFFRLMADGESIPAITHLNGSAVSPANPAQAGEWLAAWMMGLGPVNPPAVAGQAAGSNPLCQAALPIRVVVDGAETAISFAGLAPGLAGVYQVNFRVPLDTEQGRREVRVFAATAAVADWLVVARK